jgi:hypothetical protein
MSHTSEDLEGLVDESELKERSVGHEKLELGIKSV